MKKIALLTFGLDELFLNEETTIKEFHTFKTSIITFLKKINTIDMYTIHQLSSTSNDNFINYLKSSDIVSDSSLLINTKNPNGFFQTNLNPLLEKLNIDSLILMGLLKNMNMETTSSTAYFSGYNVIVLDDLIISQQIEDKTHFIDWLNIYFGNIKDSDSAYEFLIHNDSFESKTVEIP